jgi:hypothetical protein
MLMDIFHRLRMNNCRGYWLEYRGNTQETVGDKSRLDAQIKTPLLRHELIAVARRNATKNATAAALVVTRMAPRFHKRGYGERLTEPGRR